METCSTENGGSYASCTEAELKRIEPTLGSAPFVTTGFTKAASSYKITMEGAQTTQKFWVERTGTGELKFECEKPKTGGCPAGATEAATVASWAKG